MHYCNKYKIWGSHNIWGYTK